jgi:diketogulonate reductase-like aldo/keto reductase
LNSSLVLDEIGVEQIDTLILSFPDKIFSRDELPKELLIPLWSIVQQNIQNKRVIAAGICDFNANYLEQLINALEDKNVNINFY